MLQSLKIENIAIIENASLELTRGFNVLTGETGAGKSIIIDSLNAVLGERTSRELIRTGAPAASVSALFTECSAGVTALLNEYGIEYDGELLIARRISSDGKSTCRVNGSPVTAAMLKTLGRELVNIHGQHDSQSLLSPEKHGAFIDSLAGNDTLRERYRDSFTALRSLERKIAACTRDEAEKSRRIDMLEYQINELQLAQLRPGERDELTAKRALHRNAEKVLMALGEALGALSGDDEIGGAVLLTEAAAKSLSDVQQCLPEFGEVSQRLYEISYDLDEYSRQIRSSLEGIQLDGEELQYTEERLDLLHRLSRKYGESEEDMLAFLENAMQELSEIESSQERLVQLEREKKQCETRMLELAEKLSDSRKTAAKKFEQNVKSELEFLDMPSVEFTVKFERCEPSADGIDETEFLISANTGELPRPLARIASGGELSRIMLAIKNVLNEKDGVATLVFDEIDSGVSGRAAQKVAMKLQSLANTHQVVCVTHLSQIAARADEHLLISKSESGGKTYTRVSPLDFEGRKREIARINGGLDITQLQLDNAGEMLRAAQQKL